ASDWGGSSRGRDELGSRPETGMKKPPGPSPLCGASPPRSPVLCPRRAPPPRTTVGSIRFGLRPVASLAASRERQQRYTPVRACCIATLTAPATVEGPGTLSWRPDLIEGVVSDQAERK